MAHGKFINPVKAAASGGGGTPIGRMINKTGQAASNTTGDDGDLEAGELTDFLTLSYNNPFGHNKRFTGTTGGYKVGGTYYNSSGGTTTQALAFPGAVILDWSVWETGATQCLAYYMDFTYRNLADHCLAKTSSTIGGLANNWRLTNFLEMSNILNNSLLFNYMLNYPPFDTTQRYFWVSSNGSASSSGIITELAGPIFTSASKTNSYYAIFVRTCTVSGTTIT